VQNQVLLDPTKLNGLAGRGVQERLGDNIGVDQLASLAQSVQGIGPDQVVFTSVPVGGAPEATKSLFTAVINGTPLPFGGRGRQRSAGRPKSMKIPGGQRQRQGRASHQHLECLGAPGFPGRVGGQGGHTIDKTTVRYAPGREAQARTLAAAVPGSKLVEDSSLAGAVQLVTGPEFDGNVVTPQAPQKHPAGDRRVHDQWGPTAPASDDALRRPWFTSGSSDDAVGATRARRLSAMREAYHDQLGELADQLASMCGFGRDAMEQATKALLDAESRHRERVISGDAKIDDARAKCEEDAYALLRYRPPSPPTCARCCRLSTQRESLERMGDLALHVAKAARRRHPAAVLPEEVRGYFAEMGRIAVDLAHKAQQVIRTQDVDLARRLDDEDDAWMTCTGTCSR